MKLTVRRIGNSLGIIVPRKALAEWGIPEGGSLDLTAEGIFPGRRRPSPGHPELDDLKRAIAAEVVARFRPEEIRSRSLENLDRWSAAGVWCDAYAEWRDILQSRDDARLFAAMLGDGDEANRLRQSMPYVGMLPKDVLQRLREKATR